MLLPCALLLTHPASSVEAVVHPDWYVWLEVSCGHSLSLHDIHCTQMHPPASSQTSFLPDPQYFPTLTSVFFLVFPGTNFGLLLV